MPRFPLSRATGYELLLGQLLAGGDTEVARNRQLEVLFRAWQVIAGFEQLYPFHALRHAAVTNVYWASVEGPLSGAEIREACESIDDCRVHARAR